jgi:hypothetical protein
MARVGMMQRDGSVVLAAKNMYANGHVSRVPAKADGVVQLMFGHSRLRAFMVLSEGIKSLGKGHAIGLDFTTVGEIETRFAELLDADLDYTEMPLMLGFALDHAMWAHAITENSQRKNITAIEEATSIQRAIDEFGLTTEEAGKPFGYARSTTANKLRLLNLPAEVRLAISRGELTERHGRELARLIDDPETLAATAAAAIKKGATVRQLATDVDWKEQRMKDAQAREAEKDAAARALAAGWTLPGQSTPVPVDRMIDDGWSPNPFDSTVAEEAALIEGGHCGPQCACFAIKFSSYRHTTGYRPDPEQAPHVVAVCSNYQNQRAKAKALALADVSPEAAAKKADEEARLTKAAALTSEAAAIWETWLKEQDLQVLWNDIRLWKAVAKEIRWLYSVMDNCESVHDACQELLRVLYRSTRGYDRELQNEVHQPEYVRALIKSLGGKA